MGKILVDTQVCRREAERLRRTALDIAGLKSRLIALIGGTGDVWQGAAATAHAASQEYTIAELARLIADIEEAAAYIERIAAKYESLL